MKGYKGMKHDMTCRGMQYELGNTYHVDGEIKICENGLHFCENLNNVFNYYDIGGLNRFFEIEATGDIKTDGKKSVSSDMTILRELSEIEVKRCYYNDRGYGYGNGYGDGDGYGNGNGYGYGYGGGYSYGNGNGNGYGDGDGDGNGNGNGNGDGDGFRGDVYKIMKFI